MPQDQGSVSGQSDVVSEPTVSRFAEPLCKLFDARMLFAQQTVTAAQLFTDVVNRPLGDNPSNANLALRAHAHFFLANLSRDQGRLRGVHAAQHHYGRAERYAYESGERSLLPRARLLRLGVIGEMNARTQLQLQRALRHYLRFADEDRLSEVNKGWSLVWAGSVQTKLGLADDALVSIRSGIRILTNEGNPANSAYFKLTGALLAAGRQREALKTISELALPPSAPLLQVVRKEIRLGNVLLSDPATFDEGVRRLRCADQLAGQAGLGHQLRSVQAIRARFAIPQ